MAVAAIALENKATEDEAIAALLHDVVEDGGGPKAAQEMPNAGVNPSPRSSSPAPTPKTTRRTKAPWKNRKEDYIASIATKSESTLLVSGSDKLHNARSILDDFRAVGPKVWERFNTTDPTAQLWYYGRLATELTKRANNDAPRTSASQRSSRPPSKSSGAKSRPGARRRRRPSPARRSAGGGPSPGASRGARLPRPGSTRGRARRSNAHQPGRNRARKPAPEANGLVSGPSGSYA